MRVALLRGINIGTSRPLPMAELRAACTDAGLLDVVTYIRSGNVVFGGGPAAEQECADLITEIVEARFGFRVPVGIRTGDELHAVLAAHPFDAPAAGEKMLHVLFCTSEPTPAAIADLDPDRSAADRWAVIGREVHVRYGNGSGRSKATVGWFERVLGVAATGRNLLTVRALADLARAA